MNTTMLLNNVLPAPANRSAHSPARRSSSFDLAFAKNATLQQNDQISLEDSVSYNPHNVNPNTLSKAKSVLRTNFKNIFNSQIKSRKSDNDPAADKFTNPATSQTSLSPVPVEGYESASQKTDVETHQQNCNPSPNGSQPIEPPVINNDASTPASPIPDIAISCDTAPASNLSPQLVDNTPQTQITSPSTLNAQCLMPDASSNQELFNFIQQSSQSDSSQQSPPIASNQPVLNTPQLITSPDKSNVPAQQKTENIVSLEPPVIRNQSIDNLIPNTNLDSNSAYSTTKEGQPTHTDYTTSALSGSLAVAGTATSKVQPDTPLAESLSLQTVNIIKTNQTNESNQVKSQEQNRTNQQPSDSSANQQSAIDALRHPEQGLTYQAASKGSNQQLIQHPVSQEKTASSPEKPDTLKEDLQNVNTTSQIARDITTPESNVNITNTTPARTALESAHNLTSANNDPAGAIREQISQSVAAAAQQLNRQITIQLNPPELGKVSVKFSQTGAELTGFIEASNPRTRADINQQIPEIIRSLEQAGVTVKRIDVTLSDLPGRSNHDSPRDNSSQFNWDRTAGYTFNDSPRRHFSSDSYMTPSQYLSTSSKYEPRVTSHESRISSSALDILI
jgi:flagellar hook-length control protein FliK